ncbi:CYFA0S22e00870g1_1 [Cyberlindnera fabianii]|uniref:CYFA0S22e00870g1_1 n=1 Tax=Cyberlindnera fabianii TaxID=36022 RepID=A0A061B8C3_CYBFA|nr:CYFA0S22e00870g1_1 [Cyberlindnera fabianii]
MNSSVTSAIRDVAPTLPEPIPDTLRQLTERLYASSRQKIPLKQHEEAARYHICAIVAVNRNLSELNITNPTLNGVPLPAKSCKELVQLFTSRLDAKNQNASSPIKNQNLTQTPKKDSTLKDKSTAPVTPSPRKRGRPPGSGRKTPLTKKLEAAADDSPIKKTPQKSSPNKKLQKKIEAFAAKDLAPPLEATVSGLDLEALTSPEKQFILLSSREITALCNKFEIESEITKHIIDTFQQYFNKVTNEWILICGLVLNCYFVVNHRALESQVGAKTSVFKIMFNLQNGGLMLNDIHSSVGIVRSIIEYSRWFKKLRVKYNYPASESISFTSDSMIGPAYRFHSAEAREQQAQWLDYVRSETTIR